MNTAHRTQSRLKQNQGRPTAWIDAVAASKPPPEHRVTMIINRVRTAFEALKNGTSDCEQFDRLAVCINVGLIRSEAIDPLCEQTMLAAIVAMGNADAIYGRHRKYGFYGPDLQAVADAVDLYEEILRNSTPHQMENAAQESARRMMEQVKQERKAA